jgi:hypothetical protein
MFLKEFLEGSPLVSVSLSSSSSDLDSLIYLNLVGQLPPVEHLGMKIKQPCLSGFGFYFHSKE